MLDRIDEKDSSTLGGTLAVLSVQKIWNSVALHNSYNLDNVATEMQTTGSASVVLPVDIDYVCSRFYDGRHGFFKMPLV